MSRFFAGLDVSTQGCKLVVIDLDSEDVCHVESVTYDTDLPEFGTRDGVIQGLGEGVSESDPHMWLRAVDHLLASLRGSEVPASEIRCISVSAQQHGLVALDSGGNLARPTSKLWNDYSTAEECEILTDRVGGPEAMIEAVGNSQRPGYTAGKIFHLKRHEPEAYDRSTTLFLVHNFVNWYLTGGVAVMEPGDTSGMALWHPAKRQWSRQVIDAIDPDLLEKLPPVRRADESIGRIAAPLVERFGFSPTCKVDAGSGDNMYTALGTGIVREGLVTVSLGTSGTACCFMEEPFVDPRGEIAAYCDSTGHYLPLLCVSNLANGYNELLRLHGRSHGEFDAIIEQTSPWDGGRILVPWFGGERTPDQPWGTPVHFGFSLDSMTKENLCRAVLDGHVLNLQAGFTRMPVQVEELRLTGGLSRSAAWCQAIADVFEVEVVPVEGEGAALGAALHAAWVWLAEEGDPRPIAELVDRFVVLEHDRRREPVAENVAVYRKMKTVFRALSRRLRGLQAEDPFRLRADALR
jgi:xylulokinase